MSDLEYSEEERQRRRALRIQQMKKEKERSIRFWKGVKIAVPSILLLVVVICIVVNVVGHGKKDDKALADGSMGAGVESQETGGAEAATGAGMTSQEATGAGATTGQDAGEATSGTAAEGVPGQEANATNTPEQNVSSPAVTNPGDGVENVAGTEPEPLLNAQATADTIDPGEEIISTHALLIDLETDEILAMRDAYSTISPASMTKVLTVLVAAEHITEAQLDDTFTMTLEITDYGFIHDCSNTGFLDGEVITVRDLFYGTILPSGADAAVGLAVYVAGSHEAFVEMMNEKLSELGLSDTAHVTNCVGIYDEEHYCTTYDMAVIMKAALQNEICKEVMTAHTYTTSFTEQHPEGILISNWFLRRIEDKDTGGEVICAKTGFVNQSGSCAVSYGMDNGGNTYICVTANATSSWKCIYDHVALYKMFATGDEKVE